MKYLIRNARLIAKGHENNGAVIDIEVSNGKITQMGTQIDSDGSIIEDSGLCVSAGWFDLRAHFEDPGNEIREDLQTGLDAAAKGGFTGVAINPATDPPIDNKSSIEYLLRKSDASPVDVFPYGTVTEGRKGLNISQMYDMHQAGAIGFSDDLQSISNPSLLLRAMQYVAPFDGLIVQFGLDKDLAGSAQVHEGEVATGMGLKGIPAMAESTILARDIDLANYAEHRLHFQSLSSSGGVDLIKRAKKNSQPITADVAGHQLIMNDQSITDFDSNVKVMPPLRSKADQAALITGINQGTIDAICSDHRPIDVEGKDVDFTQATYGMVAIQTLFSSLNTALNGKISLETIVEKLTTGPRQVLRIPHPTIEVGAMANLTLFNPDSKWTLKAADLSSKSKNSPLIGQELKGKVIGIINGKKAQIADKG